MKEMDHFVASVETPKVSVKIPDIAVFVLETLMEGLEPVPIDIPTKSGSTENVELYIQTRFRTPDNRVKESIWEQACGFYRLLSLVMHDILLLPMDPVRVFYATTIRADKAVASRSEVDGFMYFNLLSFQQQQSYKDGQLTQPKRTLLYWLQRTAMILPQGPEQKPTGLYDPEIRARFKTVLQSLEANPAI